MTLCPAVPTTLTDGTIADAIDVMADLNSIKNAINGNIGVAGTGLWVDGSNHLGLYAGLRRLVQQVGNYQVVEADVGTVFSSQTAGGAQVLTLPARSTLSAGFSVAFIRKGGNNITVNTSSGDGSVIITTYGSDLTTIALGVEGSFVWLFCDGSNWINIAYSDTFRWQSTYLGNSLGALNSSGYQSLPSGYIREWGRVSVGANAAVTVTLPLALPSNMIGATATPNDGGTGTVSGQIRVANLTSTTVDVVNGTAGTLQVFWEAWGK